MTDEHHHELKAIENDQRAGIRLTESQHGLLSAIRRHTPELAPRVQSVLRIDAQRRAKRKQTGDADGDRRALDDALTDFLRGR